MSLPKKKMIAALLAVLLLTAASAETYAAERGGQLYAVVFGILVNENDKIVNIRVAKVIDPSTGSTAPVPIKPADSYLAAAEKFIRTKGYSAKLQDGKPVEFFTYFFYDPTQPERIDIDPKARK